MRCFGGFASLKKYHQDAKNVKMRRHDRRYQRIGTFRGLFLAPGNFTSYGNINDRTKVLELADDEMHRFTFVPFIARHTTASFDTIGDDHTSLQHLYRFNTYYKRSSQFVNFDLLPECISHKFHNEPTKTFIPRTDLFTRNQLQTTPRDHRCKTEPALS